ncbi:MAG: phosphate-starvation-inducible PsiE family protein [Actinomycetia bacterium]|nr:phosphate-starvation-inducible PsiE family protein [Actinomycetes bacterium]
MLKFLKRFEQIIAFILISMMSLIIVLSVLELGWTITKDIIDNFKGPLHFMVLDNLLAIFGLFLLILIGVELLETMKIYLREDTVHIEVIILVAIIAIARKAVVLDLEKVDAITIMSLGVLVIALSAGYFIIKKVRKK